MQGAAGMMNIQFFEPPGPVGAAFMNSTALVNSIMGPVGSGKTSCVIVKILRLAAMQAPSRIDGVRYVKAMFVRQTYKQLADTTMPSWFRWVPKHTGKWSGDGAGGGQHHLRFKTPEGGIIDLLVEFVALGEQNVEQMMRGREFNILVLNEGDTLVPDVLSQGLIRVVQGRYPGARHVEPELTVKEVMIDYNAPDTENYLYRLNEENRPASYGFFRQPGGLSPMAENRKSASREGYEQMKENMLAQGREDLVRRMIDNLYGFSRAGKPVYPEYRDDFHCAGTVLPPVPGLPIKISADQGLHPAAVLRQTLPNGQRRYLAEIYCDTGAEGLAAEVKAVMGREYAGYRLVGAKADPAGNARGQNDAESWIDCFNRHLNLSAGARIDAAESNAIDKCTTAVRVTLKRTVDNAQPAILISAACRMMRKGFNSDYCYRRKKGSTGAYEDKPIKKFPVSDVMNAVEFDCFDEGGYEDIVGRARRNARAVMSVAQTSFNVWGAAR